MPGRVWTFFPDPWRKAGIVSVARLRFVLPSRWRACCATGRRRLATDWDDYAWQMRDVVRKPASCLTGPPGTSGPGIWPERGGFAPRSQERRVVTLRPEGIVRAAARGIVGIRVRG